MEIKPTNPVQPAGQSSQNRERPAPKESAPPPTSQRLLAQVTGTGRDGLTHIKTLPGGQQLQIQTSSRLVPGQLVVVEQTGTQLRLDSQPRLIADQLLRHLLPHSGSLKAALQGVVSTALSQQTALSAQTALSQQTALSGQTALSAQTPTNSSNSRTAAYTAPNAGSQTALSQQTALSGQTALSAQTAPGAARALGATGASSQPPSPNNGPAAGQTSANTSGANAGTGGSQATASGPALNTLLNLARSLPPELSSALAQRFTGAAASTGNLSIQNQSPIVKLLEQVIQNLPPTRQLTDPAQVATLLQAQASGAASNGLLKLLLPLLSTTLLTAPVTSKEQEQRQDLLPRLNQLLARALLSGIRSPTAGQDAEVTRGEWLSRQDNQIDHLQFELGVVRERQDESQANHRQQAPAEKINRWTVRLSFDFEELGVITAFIVLSRDTHLEMNFWAERASTRQKIDAYRDRFRTRLDAALQPHGIDQLDIGVFEGEAPRGQAQVTRQLVNERA